MKLGIAQLNLSVGDIAGNTARLLAAAQEAHAAGAALLLTPEMSICGYPAEDLVLRRDFTAACAAAVEKLAADAPPELALIVGYPERDGHGLFNAAALLRGGRIETVYRKHHLPNHSVFDEQRVFDAGDAACVFACDGLTFGLNICGDIWEPGPATRAMEAGADWLLVPNASPFHLNKERERVAVARARLVEAGLPIIYANMVGGQDELVFDGASFVLRADRSLAVQLPSFVECMTTLHWTRSADGWRCDGEIAAMPGDDEGDYAACVLGLRDYVNKNGFPGVLLGVSGGIDSALCAALAVDALGAERVRGIMLPFRYTAQVSLDDAAQLARSLGISYEILPIAPAVNGFEEILAAPFKGLTRDITEENLQARTRGVLLMAISNKSGAMLVTTGNKSEMSVGYATLYGDMNGGFNPIKDLYKTQVFRLSSLRNRWKPEGALGPSGVVIPESIIVRPPTAELRDNQLDQDSLPPYEVLDGILERLVEREEPLAAIVEAGFDRETVARVDRLLNIAEYKRRQAAPGVKVTRKNFGRDRRYPITNRFRDLGKPLPQPDHSLVNRSSSGSVTYDE